MPIPNKKEGEKPNDFMSRCMSDNTMKEEYPANKQRTAVCLSKAGESLDYMEAADFNFSYEAYGFEEEINEDSLVIPEEDDYIEAGEEVEEWDIAADRPGLWENIRKKKEREGKKYRPAKPGDPDRPDPDAWKKAQSKDKAGPMQDYVFESKEAAEKMAEKIGLSGVHSHKSGDNKTLWMPGKNMEEFQTWYEKHQGEDAKGGFKYKDPKTGEVYEYERKGIYKKSGRTLIPVRAAKYQGRTVKLNKPFRTPDGPKKFSVYVKNEKGNVVKVNFGDPNMEIKKDNPARRKSFRARHKCDTPGPKWKARYWSCKKW